MRNYFFGIFFVIFIWSHGALYAAEASFTKASRSTITRANDVIENPPTNVAVRSILRFRQRETTPARALASRGFHIRIFSLGAAAEPQSVTDLDDCSVYISSVMPVRAQPDGVITIGELNEAWLWQSDSGENVRPGRYLFVFEETGPTESLFRLRSRDAQAYFEQGFVLTVDINNKINVVEARRKFSEMEQRRVQLYMEANQVRNGVPCYSYKPHKVTATDSPDLAVGELFACVSPPTELPPAS